MDPPSGLLKAGTILLLVGGILQAVGAALLLLYGTLFGTLVARLGRSSVEAEPPILFALFLVLGLLVAAGSVMAFLAYGRAKAGDTQAAFVRGLVGALLPPVQAVTLVGAILCKVSPEGEARLPVPSAPPPAWR
ncbi:MAG: hypothetical protein LC620_00785 [Halobacteriales archaeon]|nr:hypothetical protein [Halobacteriales archaeon]